MYFDGAAFDCDARIRKGRHRTGGKNDDLGDATVQGLGSCWPGRSAMFFSVAKDQEFQQTFVRAFLELAIMRRLLNEVENGLSEGLVGYRPSY